MKKNSEKEGAPVGEAPAEQLIASRKKYSGETRRTHQGNDADKAHCVARYVLKKESTDVDASLPDDKARAPLALFQLAIVADAPTRGAAQPEGLDRLSGRLADG